MSCSFRTVRKFWIGLMALISCTCVALSICLLPYAHNKGNLWVLIAVPLISLGGVLYLNIRQQSGRRGQLVAVEAIWSFALLPFEIVLIVSTHSVRLRSNSPKAILLSFHALEICTIINAALVLLYSLIIILLATLTQSCFDADVWFRDIHASPSPFPIRMLLAYTLSPFQRPSVTPTSSNTPESEMLCVPGCECSTKPRLCDDISSTGNEDWSGSRSHVPIRIPDEMERRASIAVSLEV